MSYNSIKFDLSNSKLLVTSTNGCQIYNISPLQKIYEHSFGNLAIIQTQNSSSLVALVGKGDDLRLSPRKLILMNLVDESVIRELTYASSILDVLMNENRLVVSILDRIYIYDLLTLKLLDTIDSLINVKSLLTISSSRKYNILVYPLIQEPNQYNKILYQEQETEPSSDEENDTVPTENISEINNSIASSHLPVNLMTSLSGTTNGVYVQTGRSVNSKKHNKVVPQSGDFVIYDLQTAQPLVVVEAHKSNLACICLSQDGSLLATASKFGTLIRIFRVSDGTKLLQLRRGTYSTEIKHLNFSVDNKFLAVSSTSNTIHIFSLDKYLNLENESVIDKNISDISGYVNNEPSLKIDDNTERNDLVILDGHNNFLKTSPNTVSEFLKKSSKAFSRQATKQINKYFSTNYEKTILDPIRSFAFCELPSNTRKNINMVTIGEPVSFNRKFFAQAFESLDPLINSVAFRFVKVITTDGILFNFLLNTLQSGECKLYDQCSLLDTYL